LDLDDVCTAIVHMLAEGGVSQVTVIAISVGGGATQYLLQTQPQRVEHAVLSHCGPIRNRPELEKSAQRLLTLVRWLPLAVTRWGLLRRTTGTVPAASQ